MKCSRGVISSLLPSLIALSHLAGRCLLGWLRQAAERAQGSPLSCWCWLCLIREAFLGDSCSEGLCARERGMGFVINGLEGTYWPSRVVLCHTALLEASPALPFLAPAVWVLACRMSSWTRAFPESLTEVSKTPMTLWFCWLVLDRGHSEVKVQEKCFGCILRTGIPMPNASLLDLECSTHLYLAPLFAGLSVFFSS